MYVYKYINNMVIVFSYSVLILFTKIFTKIILKGHMQQENLNIP